MARVERATAARVGAAFDATPRVDFLPSFERRFARVDRPLPIGHGQTNSQPSTVRAMLEMLDARPGDRVLDVGCGSGWTTALLAHLVGPSGEVVGVERVPQLVEAARAHLAGTGRPWTRVVASEPGVLGLPDLAPWDRVLVSAEAARLPGSLVGQLRVGGVMVVPVAGTMERVVRGEDGVDVERLGSYAFVPLVED
ncbi:MAG: protein-L-isoaspartate O-methyltransferase family protein [Nocardioidaceae bacterium]